MKLPKVKLPTKKHANHDDDAPADGKQAVKKAGVVAALEVTGEKIAEAAHHALEVAKHGASHAAGHGQEVAHGAEVAGTSSTALEVVGVAGHVLGPAIAGYEALHAAREFRDLAGTTKEVLAAADPVAVRDHLARLGITAGEFGGHVVGVFVPGVSPVTTLVGYLANRVREEKLEDEQVTSMKRVLLPLADGLDLHDAQRLPFRVPDGDGRAQKQLQDMVDYSPLLNFGIVGFRALTEEEIPAEVLRLAKQARTTTEHMLDMPYRYAPGYVGAYLDKEGNTTLVVERHRPAEDGKMVVDTQLWVRAKD